MKRFLVGGVVAVFLGLAAHGIMVYRDGSPLPIEHNIATTVTVITPDGGSGTGTIVRKGVRTYCWTAHHVVDGHKKVQIYQKIIDQKTGFYKEVATGATVVFSTDTKDCDIAILEVHDGGRWPVSARFAEEGPAMGDRVHHIGSFLGVNGTGSISRGNIAHIGRNRQLDQVSIIAFPGSSGGPLFNNRGEVTGFVVQYIPDRQGIWLYVPIRKIRDWAKRHNKEWAL